MISSQLIGKRASHHASAIVGRSNLSLRKSKREPQIDWWAPFPPTGGADYGGREVPGRGRGGGRLRGNLDIKQCKIHKNATTNRWEPLIFERKIAHYAIFLFDC